MITSIGCKADHGFDPTTDKSKRCKWDHAFDPTTDRSTGLNGTMDYISQQTQVLCVNGTMDLITSTGSKSDHGFDSNIQGVNGTIELTLNRLKYRM